MAVNIQVSKKGNESTANLLRRFTKRARGSGIIQRMRGRRYYNRVKSDNVRHAAKVKKLERAAEFQKLYKLGKVEMRTPGRR